MAPHVQRMVDEQFELNARMNKLDDFMGSDDRFDVMDPVDQLLMKQQLRNMRAYLATLMSRISRASK